MKKLHEADQKDEENFSTSSVTRKFKKNTFDKKLEDRKSGESWHSWKFKAHRDDLRQENVVVLPLPGQSP